MTHVGRWLRALAASSGALFATSLAIGQPLAAEPGGLPGAGAPTGSLSDETELARAVALYEASKYAECAQELDGLIGREPRRIDTPDVLERARVYFSACLIATGNIPGADEQLRRAIRANPLMLAPDSLVFPAQVVERFYRVKKELTAEIEQAQAAELARKRAEAQAAARRAAAERRRVERLEEIAREERVVDKNSRWLAALPFGVGQFQNRDPVLGWVFLTSEALLAGTAMTSMIIELGLNAKADDDPRPDPKDLNSKLRTSHQVLVISSWAFVAVAAVGVTQAQIAFVPEFAEVRKRPLPKELRRPEPERPSISLVPVLSPAPGGTTLGVFGRF